MWYWFGEGWTETFARSCEGVTAADDSACAYTTEGDQWKDYVEPTMLRLMDRFYQIGISGRFQEYSETFGEPDAVETPLIEPGLDTIDKVPLIFVRAKDDDECPAEGNAKLAAEIPAVIVDFEHQGDYGHLQFAIDYSQDTYDMIAAYLEQAIPDDFVGF